MVMLTAACSSFESRYKTQTTLPWGVACVRDNETIGLAGVVQEGVIPLGFSANGDQLVFGSRLFSFSIFANQRIDVLVSEPDRQVNVIDYRTPKESAYVLEVIKAIDSHIAQRCGGLLVEWKQYHAPDIT